MTLKDFLSCFIVLFAIIDAPGNLPIVLNLQKSGKSIYPLKASILSLIMLLLFFFGGEAFLRLFGVDISSFAVAGSFVIFIIALQMILDLQLFGHQKNAPQDATFMPIVFPLLIGAGVFTTLLSLRAQFNTITILSACLINVVIIYALLVSAKRIGRLLSPASLYALQKFFGIILLSIAVKIFTSNITQLISQIKS